MASADKVISGVIDKAKPVLDRFGILGAPLRDMYQGTRVITIDRAVEEVQSLLRGAGAAVAVFGGPAESESDGGLAWRIPGRGRAEAVSRPGPGGGTELTITVHLESVLNGGRPRYADNAGVIAARAVHRAKSLVETGEVASLAANPAGRQAADPYGD